jgi:UPF0042 nucleotide-binding protein
MEGTPVVGLPGNPVAAIVTFLHLARPMILRLSGAGPEELPRFGAIAGFCYRKKAGRREYVRIGLKAGETGLRAEKFPREGAGLLTSLTRSQAFAELDEAITGLRHSGTPVRVLYLDAADDVLVRRYEGTRRRHPIEGEGVEGAIAVERARLAPVRRLADVVVDTTDLNVHQLRERILDLFTEGHEGRKPLRIAVVSFGYSHGLPRDADLVLDCRFLPNPHWIPELRPHTGLDTDVRDYVLGQPAAKEFIAKIDDLLELLLPAYMEEGKAYLTIAVGCTGGRHRSVAVANALHERIESRGYFANIAHRDVQK